MKQRAIFRPVFDEYTLPVYWASYLANGDASGLGDGEQERIDEWCANRNVGPCVDVLDDASFSKYNDADPYGTLAGDVCTYTFARRPR